MRLGDHNGMIEIHSLACLHFPMAATGINKGGVSLSCGLWPFVVVWRHFHVAGRNFEEILQHLKIKIENTLKDFLAR